MASRAKDNRLSAFEKYGPTSGKNEAGPPTLQQRLHTCGEGAADPVITPIATVSGCA